MTKIPPGEYSVENGKLKHLGNSNYLLYNRFREPIATIGFKRHIEGIPQLEIRERSAEDKDKSAFSILRSRTHKEQILVGEEVYVKIDSALEAMEEYRSQPIAPVSEEEIDQYARKAFMDADDIMVSSKNFFKIYSMGYKDALSRTQSGYTRELVEKAFDDFSKHNEMDLDFVRHAFMPLKNKILAALTPSITSVTIGDNNNIINIKNK